MYLILGSNYNANKCSQISTKICYNSDKTNEKTSRINEKTEKRGVASINN